MTRAYYNEHNPFVAQWLRALIARKLIAPGDVDARSITEVCASDLRGYDQCHFFAGIGTWSYALRGARWADDRPVWTASCPCQPLSKANQRKKADRDLWPVLSQLIAECRPPVVLGEQVAVTSGRAWFAAVRLDLEAMGYAAAVADLCSASVGAPHIRQRLFWVADAHGYRLEGEPRDQGVSFRHASRHRLPGHGHAPDGFWRDADWHLGRDGAWRPAEPGTLPVAHGAPSRAYGNAVVAPLAREFVLAYMDTLQP